MVQLRDGGAHAPSQNALPGSAEDRATLKALLQSATTGSEEAAMQLRSGYVAKLCDFGSAFLRREGHPEVVARSACGSSYYCCPFVRRLISMKLHKADAKVAWPPDAYDWEAIHTAGYDAFAADVWSFGMMLFTLTTGLKPFRAPAISDPRFRAFIRETQPHTMQDELLSPASEFWRSSGKSSWSWPSSLSPALRDLLWRCLRVRVSERLTMKEVLAHPWFSHPNWEPSPTASPKASMVTSSTATSTATSALSDSPPASSPIKRGLSTAAKDRAKALSIYSGSSGQSMLSGAASLATTPLGTASVGSSAAFPALSPTGTPTEATQPTGPARSLESPAAHADTATSPAFSPPGRFLHRPAHQAPTKLLLSPQQPASASARGASDGTPGRLGTAARAAASSRSPTVKEGETSLPQVGAGFAVAR